MVVLEVKTCDGVSSTKKLFLGASKQGNKWRARAYNPMLKTDVHLGVYKTPEEAAVVAANKRAEFKEMFKDVDTRQGYFEGKKLPTGVRRNNGRYLAQVWHPVLNKEIFCGSYEVFEEAGNAVDKKRAEFQEMYGSKLGVIPDSQVLKNSDSDVASRSGCSDERSSNIKLPGGVRRISSGKWVARIKKPESKDRIWLGTYNTLEEALSAFYKKKAEFDAQLKKPEFDTENQVLKGSEGVLGNGPFHGSPTSVFDLKNINTVSVSNKAFDSEFDNAVSLGIINEYGQLLGKYSEIETPMWLS